MLLNATLWSDNYTILSNHTCPENCVDLRVRDLQSAILEPSKIWFTFSPQEVCANLSIMLAFDGSNQTEFYANYSLEGCKFNLTNVNLTYNLSDHDLNRNLFVKKH